ncbi:MAG TPA: hypothetical protein VHT27_06255 [Solirubrobacteraceae bacterium]|jgi:hypothetical protein|nr:hypothetical protein [Solirubrobacteraceae bacterium]
MSVLLALASLPLALDGESVVGNNTGIAVISLVSMVAGYVGLWALWYFVFRDKERARERRRRRRGGD